MVASVPLFTIRTISIEGTAATISSASSTSSSLGAPKLVPLAAAAASALTISGSAWPRIMGPQDPT